MSERALSIGRSGRAAAVIRTLLASKTIALGAALLLLIVLAALAAPLVSPFDPIEQHIRERLLPPNELYLLGTDSYGRDVLSRILWGARTSLVICLSGIALGMCIGAALGMIAGYKAGIADQLISRAMDVMLSFPTLIMGLLIVAVLGPSAANLILAIAFTVVPKFARIARAPTLAVKERDFIEACRALGYSDLRILAKHILPNVIGEILVLASLWTANAIRIEASLAFIGLGVKPPTASWGGMVREGFENVLDAPWLTIFPGVAILLLVFALNLLGDGLRDFVDPRQKDE